MNLYDKDDGFKVFTLKKANALLPKVIKITEKAMRSLEEEKKSLEAEEIIDEDLAREKLGVRSALVFEKWAQDIMSIGAYPKGYFTVDFKSPVPDTLFCWTYGEEVITHTHKIYQSFKDRVSIQSDVLPGFENSLN